MEIGRWKKGKGQLVPKGYPEQFQPGSLSREIPKYLIQNVQPYLNAP